MAGPEQSGAAEPRLQETAASKGSRPGRSAPETVAAVSDSLDNATVAPLYSLWEHKPWWCQPWSILSTGVMLVAVSWLGLHRWWLSAITAAAVAIWWWLFLWAVPIAYRQQMLLEHHRSPGPAGTTESP